MKLALSAVAVLGSGCVMFGKLHGGPASDALPAQHGEHHVAKDGETYRVGPYWGPECEADPVAAPSNQVTRHRREDKIIDTWDIDEPEPTMGRQPNLSHDLGAQVLRLVCVEAILADEDEPERNTWVIQHFRFDPVAFDHMTAALMLVQCLEAGSCLGEGAPKYKAPDHSNNDYAKKLEAEDEARNAGRKVWSYYEVGMMRWYADHVDPAQVQAKLALTPLSPAARTTFMELLDKARARVAAVTDELRGSPDAKRVFVDLPREVFAHHAAELAKHPKIVSELAALTERLKKERVGAAVTDETVTQLRNLRVAYHATCKQDCSKDALFVAITRQLFWAYVSRGDSAAAMVEAKLMEKVDPTPAEEIAQKQGPAIEKLRARVERVKSARDQGIDADAAASAGQGVALDFGDGRYVYRWNDDFRIDWEGLVPEAHELGSVDGTVAGLEKKGDRVVIRFQDEVSSWSEGTGCYETGRIDSISSDGHINYREQCAGSATHSERHKVDPVTVPAHEAAGLHGGDQVIGFAKSGQPQRAGRIWFVKRGNRIVRLRDITL